MSQLKIKNGDSWENIPASGIGVPSGGTTGQVLQKSSNTDYATEWVDVGFRTSKKQVTFPANTSSIQVSADDIPGYKFACWLFAACWYLNGSTPMTYWDQASIDDTTAQTITVSCTSWSGAAREITLFALYMKT